MHLTPLFPLSAASVFLAAASVWPLSYCLCEQTAPYWNHLWLTRICGDWRSHSLWNTRFLVYSAKSGWLRVNKMCRHSRMHRLMCLYLNNSVMLFNGFILCLHWSALACVCVCVCCTAVECWRRHENKTLNLFLIAVLFVLWNSKAMGNIAYYIHICVCEGVFVHMHHAEVCYSLSKCLPSPMTLYFNFF